jgi:hypothetical protein
MILPYAIYSPLQGTIENVKYLKIIISALKRKVSIEHSCIDKVECDTERIF